MKKRFTEEQILQVLSEIRQGAKVGETCRKKHTFEHSSEVMFSSPLGSSFQNLIKAYLWGWIESTPASCGMKKRREFA